MFKFFRMWMHLIALLVTVQFFLAGYGSIASGAPADAFDLHIMNGRLIAVVTLLGIVFAALSRIGGRVVWLSAAVFGLVMLQSVIVMVSVSGTVAGQIIFGFHALNALFIMMLGEKTASVATRDQRDRASDGEPAEASASAA